MQLVLLSIFILFLSSCSFTEKNRAPAQEYDFDGPSLDELFNKESYEEIKRVSLKVKEACPPPDCRIIGLGRSPTAIMAFLEEIGVQVSYLPLSAFRYQIGDTRIKERDIQKIHQHFGNFLAQVKAKRVMIVDYAYHGKSTFSTQHYLKEFMKANNKPTVVDSFLFTKSHELSLSSVAREFKHKNFHYLYLEKDNPLMEDVKQQNFDRFAKYPEINRREWGQEIPINEKYYQLKDKVRKLVDQDPRVNYSPKGNLKVKKAKIKYPASCSMHKLEYLHVNLK